MNRSLLIGAVSTLALSACANMKGFDAGAGPATVLDDLCNTNQVRCIDVVISNGAITAVKDEDFVGPNHLIIWKMNPLGAPYTFPDNGVDFKLASPAASRPRIQMPAYCAATSVLLFEPEYGREDLYLYRDIEGLLRQLHFFRSKDRQPVTRATTVSETQPVWAYIRDRRRKRAAACPRQGSGVRSA